MPCVNATELSRSSQFSTLIRLHWPSGAGKSLIFLSWSQSQRPKSRKPGLSDLSLQKRFSSCTAFWSYVPITPPMIAWRRLPNSMKSSRRTHVSVRRKQPRSGLFARGSIRRLKKTKFKELLDQRVAWLGLVWRLIRRSLSRITMKSLRPYLWVVRLLNLLLQSMRLLKSYLLWWKRMQLGLSRSSSQRLRGPLVKRTNLV